MKLAFITPRYGADIVTGWGLIDSHNTMSLPQSVIDNEMAGMLRRLNAPVEVSDDTKM